MKKAAARVKDKTKCPLCHSNGSPHKGGPILKNQVTVFINDQQAVVVGTKVQCEGAIDEIKQGSSSIKINDMPASGDKDMTLHGGVISRPTSNVFYGS